MRFAKLVEEIRPGLGRAEVGRRRGTLREVRRKMKGIATVRFDDGRIAEAELHWFEAHGIGKRKLKIKCLIDPI